MLTPEKIAAFDKAVGLTTQPGASAPSATRVNRADEIRALGQKSLVETESPADKTVLGATINAAGSGLKQAYEGFQNIVEGSTKGETPGEGIQQMGRGAIGMGAGLINTAISPISGFINSFMNAPGIKQLAEKGKQEATPVFDAVVNKISDNPQLQKFAMENPNAGAVFADLLTIGGTLFGGAKAPELKGLGRTGEIVETGISKTTGAVSDVVSGAKSKVTGMFKGKTTEEILATPENKLQRLSPEDRKVYFDAQREQASQAHAMTQEQITQKSTAMETQIKTESQAKLKALNDETQNLVNQADRASIEEAQSLKPKVTKAMQDNSATYRELVDKEISQHADTQITPKELRDYIDSRFAEDPSTAAQIKERLKITEPKGEIQPIGMTVAEEAPMSVGDIYNNTKALRQDIGKAGTKGTRVYTPDEMVTDNAISTLSDFLKSKGVDLSEANNFWRQYAPLRDKLVKTVQPFTPRGAESGTFGTFTKDIQNYVKGVKEGKTDFIKATEDLLGTKIGNTETRAALEKLSANDKAKFAEKLAEEERLSTAKLLKEMQMKEAEGKLTAAEKEIGGREFEAARKAQTRQNIKKALRYIGFSAAVLGGLDSLF